MASIPSPPRWTGDPETDWPSAVQWLNDFYKAVIVEGGLVTTEAADALIDPAVATIVTAQETANQALTLAQTNQTALNRQDAGTATIADVATSVAVTIAEQPDTNFRVAASVESVSGAPATNSKIVANISSKTTTSFTLNVVAAPGAGTSVTYGWQIQR